MGAITVSADIDEKALRAKFSPQKIDRAAKTAITRTTLRVLELIRRGYRAGGVDPETGKTGFWPLKKPLPKDPRTQPVLIKTGRLLASITKKVVELNGNWVGTVGTNVPYAIFHDQPWHDKGAIVQIATGRQAAFLRWKFGMKIYKGMKITLPKREIFVMPRPWRDEAVKILNRELMQALTGRKR